VPVRCEAVNSKAWARAMLKELDDHYSITETIGFDNDAKNLATTNLTDSVFLHRLPVLVPNWQHISLPEKIYP
jgi:hypothetical protein